MHKIAVLSDIHIKTNSRHNEYKEYFEKLYNSLREQSPTEIVICGDIFHSKTSQSPEAYWLCFDFFINLMGIAPLHIIPGNHDLNERNVQRMDAIWPVFENLMEKQIYYYRRAFDSHEMIPWNVSKNIPRVRFRSYSIMDKSNWNFTRDDLDDDTTILIGLYHGPLKGAKTDLGFIFEAAEDYKKFECCDFLFCGDIHNRFDYDSDGRFISVGNLIQQDFGESLKKGYYIYSIKSRIDFERKFVELPNLYPYLTIECGDDHYLKINTKEINGIRLRVSFTDEQSKSVDSFIVKLKSYFGDKLISYFPLNVSNKKLDKINLSKSNIISFEEYISAHPQKDDLAKLHENYVNKISTKTTTTNWKIKSIKWNNLFLYRENNEIDFEKTRYQSLGIFGANYSGKSSIIDVICFGLFGGWTKPFVKSVHFINDERSFGDVTVNLEINGKDYQIYRKLEKKKKNNDANSILDFCCLTDSKKLNGTKTTDTQLEICNLIGNMDDFLITSLSAQFNNFSLIDEKNSKRKEYFSRFLGINQYEEIFELVKDDIKSLSKEIEAISKFSNLEKEKKEIEEKIQSNIEEYKKTNSVLRTLGQQRDELNAILKEDDKNITKRAALSADLSVRISTIENFKKQLQEIELQFHSLNEEDLSHFDQNKFNENKKIEREIFLEINSLKNKQNILNTKYLSIIDSKEKYKTVPCKLEFAKTCHFLIKNLSSEDESQILEELKNIEQKIHHLNESHNLILKEITMQEFLYKKYMQQVNVVNKKAHLKNEIDKYKNFIKEIEITIEEKTKELNEISYNKDYELNKKRLNQIIESIQVCANKITKFQTSLTLWNEQHNSIEENLKKVSKLKESLELLIDYSTLIGKNGIIMNILTNYIPEINKLINNIISNIVNFTVSITIEEGKYIEIYVMEDGKQRLIESCSGSQKSIIACALRLAVLQYSQICLSDLFILDEPGTSLDSEHLIEFMKLLDIIKSFNKTILIVSHIQGLKDYVDKSIIIEKTNGYSKLIS